jgi:hypothetical protein
VVKTCLSLGLILLGWAALLSAEPGERSTAATGTAGGWRKFEKNPVLGGKYGTCFDVAVLHEAAGYRMWLSWRPKRSIALVVSVDGLKWNEPPQVVLLPRPQSGWEDDVNRPAVLVKSNTYHMWYTGQAKGHSAIGYATSADGLAWNRQGDRPVLSPEQPWEKVAVMCPDVDWDAKNQVFRMWYSGGDQYEPDAIGFATSPDGLSWVRNPANPVFRCDPANPWEKHKVTACQVIQQDGWYYMFYIGFSDINHAQIGIARSRDGLTGWQRHPAWAGQMGPGRLLQTVRFVRGWSLAALVQRPAWWRGADRRGTARRRRPGIQMTQGRRHYSCISSVLRELDEEAGAVTAAKPSPLPQ